MTCELDNLVYLPVNRSDLLMVILWKISTLWFDRVTKDRISVESFEKRKLLGNVKSNTIGLKIQSQVCLGN